MGWYIGQKETVDEVVTNFEGDFTSNEAYLGLTDTHYIWLFLKPVVTKDENDVEVTTYVESYMCRSSIGIWKTKTSKLSGAAKQICVGLPNDIEFELTYEEMLTPLGTKSIFGFLTEKLITKIYELKPTWENKLILDF